jgi:hypothetical protein
MIKKQRPAGATIRTCPVCGKQFKPMTEAQWRINYIIHEQNSIRHKSALQRKDNQTANCT